MIYTLDPLHDARWDELIARHDSASIFHSRPWLEAIHQTYGYTPVVYTSSPPSSSLSNGIVLCEINSWLTGRRMVSLPFSDHCEPLSVNQHDTVPIVEELKGEVDAGRWKYIELRPRNEPSHLNNIVASPSCYLHMLDLHPGEDDIFRRTHKTAVQQQIRRAEREGLVYESGNNEHLLTAFYRLMIKTRRRHQLPPQPLQWFKTLASCMGDLLQIRVAFKGSQEIASILTLQHKEVVVYKYGCSDAAFRNMGGTPFLLWRTITEARMAGLTCMDFGRSDANNPGLISFKDRWGAKSSTLTYLRYSRNRAKQPREQYSSGIAKRLFAMMPGPIQQATGRILYRHVG